MLKIGNFILPFPKNRKMGLTFDIKNVQPKDSGRTAMIVREVRQSYTSEIIADVAEIAMKRIRKSSFSPSPARICSMFLKANFSLKN